MIKFNKNSGNKADIYGLIGKASGGDFVTAYTAATQITCSVLPSYHPTLTAQDIVKIVVYGVDGNIKYELVRNEIEISVTLNVLTIAGATFVNTDIFAVYTNIENLIILAPVLTTLLDDDNVAAATHYYPGTAGKEIPQGYNDLSITGYLEDADGNIAVTLEGSNDGGYWVQLYGYDTEADDTINSISISNSSDSFAWDFDNFNYKYYRVKVVNNGATNTILIQSRLKA